MNGNDDFFGGSINPAPVPSPGTPQGTNVYAPPGTPVVPVRSTSTPAVPVILVVVGALLAVATFVGGAHGGRMQCVNIAISGRTAGACTWIAEDTIGMLMLITPETDVAHRARTVREAIEQ